MRVARERERAPVYTSGFPDIRRPLERLSECRDIDSLLESTTYFFDDLATAKLNDNFSK